MDIPFTTLGTVLGLGIVRSIASVGAAGAALEGGAPARRANTISTVVAVGTAAAALAGGYYLKGSRRPNTMARGLMWGGGIGLGFGVPAMLGAMVAEGSAPEAQPARISGAVDTDLVADTYATMKRQLGWR